MSATAHSLEIIGILLWPVMPKKMEAMLDSLGCKFNSHTNYIQRMKSMSWKNSFVIQQIAALFAKSEIKKEDIEQESAPVETSTVDTTPGVEKKSAVSVEKPAQVEQDATIGIEDFLKLDLRIGTIVACEIVEGSDKLLKSQVDFGSLGVRQILSGVRKSYTPEEMKGKQGLFVVNLKPRKMMGHESHGMMLFASDEIVGLKIMSPVEQVAAGTKVG